MKIKKYTTEKYTPIPIKLIKGKISTNPIPDPYLWYNPMAKVLMISGKDINIISI